MINELSEAEYCKMMEERYGLTTEQAKELVKEGEHKAEEYITAHRVLDACSEPRMARYAKKLYNGQCHIDETKEKMEEVRQLARTPRPEANKKGTAEDIIVAVDGALGIYAPQRFCEKFNYEDFDGISEDDWNIVLAGPHNEEDETDEENFYWDAWDNITSFGSVVLNPSTLAQTPTDYLVRYHIVPEGDIYLVPEGISLYDDGEDEDIEPADKNEAHENQTNKE